MVDLPPNRDQEDVLRWLFVYDPSDHVALAPIDHSIWVQHTAKKQTILDTHTAYINNTNERIQDLETIRTSFDLDQTRHLLQKYVLVMFGKIHPQQQNVFH